MSLFLAIAWNGLIIWYGKKQWIDYFHAVPIEGQDPWNLQETVDELSLKARVPQPDLYISKLAFPFVVTLGANPSKPSIIVSEELVTRLDRAELKAALAVEMARLRMNDLRWMGVIGGLLAPLEVGLLTCDKILSFITKKNMNWFRRQMRPFVQLSLRLLRGRNWAFQLDKLAVQMTRDEESLIRVLKKLESYAQKKRPYLPESISPFLPVDPLTAQRGTSYFRAQPSVRDRLERLKSH
jgi:Zn-dependent protease with chaperone function